MSGAGPGHASAWDLEVCMVDRAADAGTRRLVSAVTPVPGGLGSQVKMSTRLSTLAEPTSSSWCAVHSALRTCSGLFRPPPASSCRPPPAAPGPASWEAESWKFIYMPASSPCAARELGAPPLHCPANCSGHRISTSVFSRSSTALKLSHACSCTRPACGTAQCNSTQVMVRIIFLHRQCRDTRGRLGTKQAGELLNALCSGLVQVLDHKHASVVVCVLVVHLSPVRS